MPKLVTVAIHPSQSPKRVQADLRECLRRRQINHKFHYDSYKQTQKWLEIHQALAPSRTDAGCAACYDAAFGAAAEELVSRPTHVIGLGCGGGQKDTRLLRLLSDKRQSVFYTPVDASLAMVLVAHETASSVISSSLPLVCDLASADDLNSVFCEGGEKRDAARLITFFGMLPNFTPNSILPKVAALLRPSDLLLLSANLAPGTDYAAGLRRVLPLYDNALTRHWLLLLLLDLGFERNDGAVHWEIEPCPEAGDLLRFAAWFQFTNARVVELSSEKFRFDAGDTIRLFFSYRYTLELVRRYLARYGLAVRMQWVSGSGEEGVFLCARM